MVSAILFSQILYITYTIGVGMGMRLPAPTKIEQTFLLVKQRRRI
jgi:hypothetical protein